MKYVYALRTSPYCEQYLKYFVNSKYNLDRIVKEHYDYIYGINGDDPSVEILSIKINVVNRMDLVVDLLKESDVEKFKDNEFEDFITVEYLDNYSGEKYSNTFYITRFENLDDEVKSNVKIEVGGGVVQNVEHDDSVKVEIVDYDEDESYK